MWALRTGSPYLSGSAAWVAPATRENGTPVVLKVSWPHPEARDEALALRLWDGDGAVRVFEHDAERYALVLERCEPGVTMSDSEAAAEDSIAAAAEVARRLWREPPADHRFDTLADVTARWAELVRERMARYGPPYDGGLVELGAGLLESLPATATESVVVHGDFNPGNLLSSRRAPWLAIDAKPMVGDPAYDPDALLLQIDPPLDKAGGPQVLIRRTRLFADVARIEAGRILAWSVARHVESALWDLTRDDAAGGPERMRHAATIARLAGI